MNIKIKHKCRNCGKIIENSIYVNEIIHLENEDSIRIHPNFNKLTAKIDDYTEKCVPLISSHICDNGMLGITDLVALEAFTEMED